MEGGARGGSERREGEDGGREGGRGTDVRVVGGGDVVVGERLSHVLINLSVGIVKQVVLWAEQEVGEPCKTRKEVMSDLVMGEE